MPPTDGTPLDAVPDLSPDLAAALRAAWVTTAEQFVAATAAAGGPDALAGHLDLPAADVRRGLAAAGAVLPAAERARLARPADTRDRGLGAAPPRPD